MADKLIIGSHSFSSRLMIGTGKYKNLEETKSSIEASQAEVVTVALRRVNLKAPVNSPNLLEIIKGENCTVLPNTAGCFDAKSAILTCELARELLDGSNLVKLEVLGEKKTLYPNLVETLKAAKILVKEGFEVMVYTSDDPIVAKELEEIGCVSVMPLASPIGSGQGIKNKFNIEWIIKNAKVPIIIDAGIGTASDATIAMEMGADGVLLNTAIAEAGNVKLMAEAMNLAVKSGRKSFLAKRMRKRDFGSPSSPDKK